MTHASERARVLDLLERHGWNATSFQTLATGFRYWFAPGGEACVAYVDTGSAWVAAAAPIAPHGEIGEVAHAFVAAARAERRRACFFGTEDRFTGAVPFRAIRIGEQPIWDPQRWDEALQASPNLREQLRRARAKGVAVRELHDELALNGSPETTTLRARLEELARRWLATRPLPPMRFLVRLEPFAFLERKRCWVAERDGEPVGLLVAVPIYDREGWLFENLVRTAGAPNGVNELLVAYGMEALRAQGCTYATLGLIPLSGPIGVALRVARTLGRRFYDFEGLRRFKTKLQPTAWTPIFLSIPERQPAAVAIYDVLTAFAGRSLGHFGWDALLSRPPFLAWVLALTLVPWTAAIALAGPSFWFPSQAVWAGWLAFDAALTGALFTLARRFRPWRAALIASCVTADAALTLAEAALFNGPRLHGAGSLTVVCVAVLGPTIAAAFLWRAVFQRIRRS